MHIYITEYVGGGEGVNGHRMLLKNVDYDALHFHTGFVENQHRQSTILGGRVSQKRVLCIQFHNVDNSG